MERLVASLTKFRSEQEDPIFNMFITEHFCPSLTKFLTDTVEAVEDTV